MSTSGWMPITSVISYAGSLIAGSAPYSSATSIRALMPCWNVQPVPSPRENSAAT